MLESALGESNATTAGPVTVVHEYVSCPAGKPSSLAVPTNCTAPAVIESRVGPATRTEGGWLAAGSASTSRCTSAYEESSPSGTVSRRSEAPQPGGVQGEVSWSASLAV